MRRFLLAVAAAAATLAAARAAAGDVVYLRNGSTIEGAVFDRGAEVEIRVRFGAVILKQREVDYIERTKTPLELYAERCGSADMGDPECVLRLICWCEQQGLDAQARELREVWRGVALERRVRMLRPDDARGLYEAALWAAAEGYGVVVERYLLERCVKIDPDHVGARSALGQAWYEGAWRSRVEIAEMKAEKKDGGAKPQRPAKGDLIHPVQPIEPRTNAPVASEGR